MKKNYKLPRMRAVEIKESDMLCTSENDEVKPTLIDMNDYDTYKDTPRNASSGVKWDGVGTGSDF